MNNKKIKLSVRHDIVNKANEAEKLLLGKGWKNVEITVDELIDHIKQGFAYTHQFTGGHRTKDNFVLADILIADIDNDIDKDPDNYMTIEQALANPLVRDHSTFIHTTARHTPERHRFRIIFVLDRTIFNASAYEAMYRTLMGIIPTDPATKSVAQPFFGFNQTEVTVTGKSLSDDKINEMVSHEMNRIHLQSDPLSPSTIKPTSLVKTRAGTLQELRTLEAKTSIQCPFGTHPDKNYSAFVKVNQHSTRGVQCRSCQQEAWSDKLPARGDSFDTFDQLVIQHVGMENSHFQYTGLGLYDHDFDTSIAKSYFHITNAKHVSIRDIVPGIHLIKSAKGTGKTHFLSTVVAHLKRPDVRRKHKLKDDRTILIGHRQSLIKESAEKLQLECYLDTTGHDTNIVLTESGGKEIRSYSQKPQHYAICLDSLYTRIVPSLEKYGIVIIDESEQVFSHLLSEHMKRPTENFTILSNLIARAKFVYCLDADLDQITLTGIMACLSHAKNLERHRSEPTDEINIKNFYCHLNQYKQPERKIELFTSKNQLTDDLLSSVTNGLRCFVTSNSKKYIEGLYQSFTGNFPDKKFKLITSESGGDPEVRGFIKNIKSEILNYDAIFSSPTIGTGIDITFPNNSKLIDGVYGFFDTNINTHFDIDQQIARVRHPKFSRIWINPARHRKSTDKRVICRELLMGSDPKGVRYFLDQEGFHATRGEHPYMDLVTEVISTQRKSINQLRNNFIKYKQNSGWSVHEIEQNDAKSARGSIINRASRVARRNTRIDKLMNAVVLTADEQNQIQKSKEKNEPVTVSQNASVERYWIEQFYNQKITEQLIEFDDDEKTRDKIRLLDLVTEPTIRFTNYEQIRVKNLQYIELMDYKARPVLKPDLKRLVFLRELFIAAGIYDNTTFQFKLDAMYDTNSLSDFIAVIKKHKERYAQLFDNEVHEHIDERPVNQLHTILKLVGLCHSITKKNRGAGSGPSKYQIDSDRHALIMGIVAGRRVRTKAAADAARAKLELQDRLE